MPQQPTQRRGRPSRASIHSRLEFEVGELRARLGGLPLPAEAEDIWTAIWYEEAHNSTAIEGNTLIQREVELLLSEGRVVGEKQLRDYMEVKGYADAAQWIYGQAVAPGEWGPDELLTLTEVREAHRRAMTPAWEADPPAEASSSESPGSWRQHAIKAFAGGMQPPSHTEVQALMTDWVASVNAIRAEISKPVEVVHLDGLEIEEFPAPVSEAIARRHAEFERIHPFLDGNGRTGRLLMNLVLVRLGYPPAIIYKRERPRYLEALRKADQVDYGPLGELLARAVLDNLMRFILPAVAGPAKLVPLEALATKALSVIALRNAAERGRLRAQRTPSGTWQSSKQWVDAYKTSRYKALKEPRPRRRHSGPGS
jgi:hypothetical protein